jgi:hypothetical protein
MITPEIITPIEFARLPEGWIKKAGRLNLITLSGSAYDMGYMHGVIAKELYVRGLIRFFAKFLRTLRSGLEDMIKSPYLQKQVGRLFERYVRLLESNLGKDTQTS